MKRQESDNVTIGGYSVLEAKKTGEVVRIALKRKNIGKGKERIEVFASRETER